VTLVDLAPAARQELLEAKSFYAAVTPALGERFATVIERALRRIGSSPTLWPRVSPRLRRYVVSGFPYTILYRIEGEQVLVVAIAHQRRRFGFWRGR
jgi:plasmid stabilization system protein ParE